MINDEQVEKAMNFLRDKAGEYAKAKAQQSYLSEFRKSKLAILMKQAAVEGHSTAAAQEREAYAHEEYQELLEGWRDATEMTELYRYQLKAAEIKVEVWRTTSANKRAERSGYGA